MHILKSTLIAIAMSLSACSEPSAPEVVQVDPAEVVEAPKTLNPEPCYEAPALATALKLAKDPKVIALYSKEARAETRMVRDEFCFVMDSGYVELGFDSEFSMVFRDSQLGKVIGDAAEKVGVSDLELAAAFYDVAP